ncbi:Tricarboxylate/iron carrier [Peziza echinospora]|nr:Tricarboxylate/iron carrier [Peziza echinospora]
MSSSIPGPHALPASQYNLDTYYGRVRHSLDLCDPRTLFTTSAQLSSYVSLISQYKNGIVTEITPEVWAAKKVVDATLHPDTGEKVLLPFRMSAFVFSNLVVTAGMLTPNMSTRAILAWQIANQSLNVAINSSNANKSTPQSIPQITASYFLAVSSSCGVAWGLNSLVPRLKNITPSTRLMLSRLIPFAAVVTAGVVNVGVMRGGEIVSGVDVYPIVPHFHKSAEDTKASAETTTTTSIDPATSLGKSRHCGILAVGETALSRVLNATPIMVLPPLILIALQGRWKYLQKNPRAILPVNLGLIFATSIFALPLALGAFPQRQAVPVAKLESHIKEELERKGGKNVTQVEFNRGI